MSSIYLNQPLAVLSALVAHEDVEMCAIAEAVENLRAAIIAPPPADVMAVIRAAARGEALVDAARVTLARIEARSEPDDTPPEVVRAYRRIAEAVVRHQDTLESARAFHADGDNDMDEAVFIALAQILAATPGRAEGVELRGQRIPDDPIDAYIEMLVRYPSIESRDFNRTLGDLQDFLRIDDGGMAGAFFMGKESRWTQATAQERRDILRDYIAWDRPPLPNLDILTVAERAARFPVGQRVRFLRSVERYPSFDVPAGAKGTVIPAEGHSVYVLLDVKGPGTEEWHGEVHWYDDDAIGDGYLEQLGGDIEPITDTPKCHGQEDEHGAPSCEGRPVALFRASRETVLKTAHGDRPHDEVFYALWCPGCAALAMGENHVTHVADIQPA